MALAGVQGEVGAIERRIQAAAAAIAEQETDAERLLELEKALAIKLEKERLLKAEKSASLAAQVAKSCSIEQQLSERTREHQQACEEKRAKQRELRELDHQLTQKTRSACSIFAALTMLLTDSAPLIQAQ